MTAFLCIPTSGGPSRRVDFSNIASLFSEAEEPPARRRGRRVLQIVAAILLVLVAIGDTVLVARPDALASLAGTAGHALVGPVRAASL